MTTNPEKRPRALAALVQRARAASRSGPRRWIGLAIGLALLAMAVAAVWSQRAVVEQAWDALGHASPWRVALLLVLPAVSWLTTSSTFWLLSQRYAPVPASDMTALIGAAWLLNHLPLRPGMIGRLAYHKKHHGMPITDSVRVMVAAMGFTGASLLLLLGIALVLPTIDSQGVQLAGLCAPSALIGLAAAASQLVGYRYSRELWAFFLRSFDMLTWTARYAIVFGLVGETVSVERVVAVTFVGQVAMLVPVSGNGLGLREWGIGLTFAALAPAGTREQAAAIGLSADLANRAAETLLVVPIGCVCMAWLARAGRRRAAERSETTELPDRSVDPADVDSRSLDRGAANSTRGSAHDQQD